MLLDNAVNYFDVETVFRVERFDPLLLEQGFRTRSPVSLKSTQLQQADLF